MGTDCSHWLGSSTSPPNKAIIHFPFGLDGPRLSPQLPICRQRGLPTFLWINHASGPSQPAPIPPSALVTRTKEGSPTTCEHEHSMCPGDVSVGVGHDQPPERTERSLDTELLGHGRHACAQHGQHR